MSAATKGTKVTAPAEGFTGIGVGGLEFTDGVAYTDDPAILAYCETAGYGIGNNKPTYVPQDRVQPEVDARDVADPTMVGGPTRDAAVDPRDDDYLPPVNAGKADPHGPDVVAAGIHGSSFGPIAPGGVEESKEQKIAEQVLARGETVQDVTAQHADDDTGPLELDDPSSGQYADDGVAPVEGAVTPPAAKSTPAKKSTGRRSGRR
ncbi:MAG: hypothetical protein JO222_09320 [Frankiales bacterium]|nr:hypothetical protein [Frankiales bacterium]